MQYITDLNEFKSEEGTCLTIGKFDGIHRGHRKLLKEVRRLAQNELVSCMFTFELFPQTLFTHSEIPLIYTNEEKRYLLEREKLVDVLVSYPFSHEAASMSAKDFVKDVLVESLNVKRIIMGEDFHFGKDRTGDVKLLKQMGSELGFETFVYTKIADESDQISSSRIRDSISRGEISKANELLGEPFFVYGTVEKGASFGHEMGFPTANVSIPANKLLPPKGVYYSRTRIGSSVYDGISNIGTAPTVSSETGYRDLRLENYMFDFKADIYGKELCCMLMEYRRPEVKFDGPKALAFAISEDVAEAKEYFKMNRQVLDNVSLR